MDCRVEYDYQAQEPDELTLTKGDIIKDVITKMDGWWEGSLNGKRGMFPDNFVKVMTSSTTSDETLVPTNRSNIAGPAGDDSAVGSTSSVNFRKNSIGNNRRLKALFSYSPEQDDELSLAVGDVVEFIAEVEEGWWKGQLKGRTGIFPSNFVTELDGAALNDSLVTQEKTKAEQSIKCERSQSQLENAAKDCPDVVPSRNPASEDEPAPKLPPKPIREVARCFYSYIAQNEDELTLKEGDTVYIISKDCEDDGWWRGELRGKVGLFPDNFVKVLTPNEPVPPPGPFTTKITAQERSIDEPGLVKKESLSPINVVDGVGQSKLDKTPDQDRETQPINAKVTNSSMKKGKEAPALPPPPKAATPTSPSSPFGGVFLPRLYERSENPVLRSNSGRKSEDKDIPDVSDFNSVERGQALNHLTVNRAKPPPKRRPPSSPNTRDSDPGVLNRLSHSEFSLETSLSHSTSVNSSANNSAIENGPNHRLADTPALSPPTKDTTKDFSGANTIAKQKMVVPWITELRKKQDMKQVSPGNQTISNPNSTPSPQSSKETAETASTPPNATTRAPPLPAKPVLPPLPNAISFDRDRSKADSPTTLHPQPLNNGNTHSSVSTATSNASMNNKSTANVASKGGQKKTVTTINHVHIGSTDGVQHEQTKEFVSFEEHCALKDKVIALENEVELLKKQLKDFSKGHIV